MSPEPFGDSERSKAARRRSWPRWRAAVVVACVGAAVAPAALAGAATRVHVIPPTPDDPRFGSEFGEVSVSGDKKANDIEVGFRPSREAFLITDSKAKMRTPAGGVAPPCDRLSRHKARCNVTPADHVVTVFGREGSNRIRMLRSVRSSASITGGSDDDRLVGGRLADGIGGYPGNDVASGRRGGDSLHGDAGRDRLAGGPGGDLLSGGDKRDRLAAGAGDDELLGGEGRNAIKCGPGRDKVVVTSGQDRIAKDCERVVHV